MKKKTIEMSLWLKISFCKENQKKESLTLIYIMTLGESLQLEEFLEKVIQLEWFRTPINSSPSLYLKLGIEHIVDHDGSWIKIISKESCISKIVLIMKLFLQIFCENILISLTIMLSSYPQLNKSIVFYIHKAPDTLSNAISYWSGASRKDRNLSWLDNCLCS